MSNLMILRKQKWKTKTRWLHGDVISPAHLQLSEDAALSTGLQILQSLRPEVLLLVRFCPVMPHSEPEGEVKGQPIREKNILDGFTHTHTHTGGLVTNRSCWWDFCEDMCSDDIHILQVYVSVGQRSPGEGFLDGTVLGLKGQRSVRYLLSVIRPLGRLQALQIETHCCYCC